MRFKIIKIVGNIENVQKNRSNSKIENINQQKMNIGSFKRKGNRK